MNLEQDGTVDLRRAQWGRRCTLTAAPLITGMASIPPQRSCLMPPLPFGMLASRWGIESGEPGADVVSTLRATFCSKILEAGESLKAFVLFPFSCEELDPVSINMDGVSEGVNCDVLGIFSVSRFSSATPSKSGVVNNPEAGSLFDPFPDFPICFRELIFLQILVQI